ncbi:GNAT family N-acetyltransferase [Fusibacter sp. 3D3]|uniref:GNAT family N-acetyltransferase n=1 Tax=Fusibacter sp. 3D3 TaxID=1048380 RepID=UPI000853A58E|nr:GNAT family N-acetyltransferase [Fusibacter sp. 3D3]GAU75435.1 acetyltransferase [Fusibacter sp. 3D3]
MKKFAQEYTLSNGKKLVLRTPQLGDEQGLIDQMKIVDKETKFLARGEGEFNFTLEQEREFISACLDDENRFFLVAEIESKIVGNCSVGLISSNKRYLHRASMGIAICKNYWNNGIGTRMMNECINWCKSQGLEQLELEVVTENSRAIPVYEKLGFKIYGTKKHAMKYAEGTYADEFFMILFLNE